MSQHGFLHCPAKPCVGENTEILRGFQRISGNGDLAPNVSRIGLSGGTRVSKACFERYGMEIYVSRGRFAREMCLK